MITVATSGVFDLVHIGHLDLLEYARSLGNRLIVGINSDDSVRALKGKDRPINTAVDRRRFLLALEVVDDVFIFYQSNAAMFLQSFKPDIWVKGGMYSLQSIHLDERAVVESYGGNIIFFPHRNHRSTTDIIERIRGRNS